MLWQLRYDGFTECILLWLDWMDEHLDKMEHAIRALRDHQFKDQWAFPFFILGPKKRCRRLMIYTGLEPLPSLSILLQNILFRSMSILSLFTISFLFLFFFYSLHIQIHLDLSLFFIIFRLKVRSLFPISLSLKI